MFRDSKMFAKIEDATSKIISFKKKNLNESIQNELAKFLIKS